MQRNFQTSPYAVLLCLAALGCAQVIGLHKSECDPNADNACLSAASGNGGDAGGSDPSQPDNGGKIGGCLDYCKLVDSACERTPQYGSVLSCAAICEQTFAQNREGVRGALQSNTLACRAVQAAAAKTGGGDGCVEAGPTGGGVCGDLCETYCTALGQLCVEEAAQLGAKCLDECRALPHASKLFSFPADNGNTYECRAYHLELAVQDSTQKGLHCQHAIGGGIPGAQPCAASQ